MPILSQQRLRFSSALIFFGFIVSNIFIVNDIYLGGLPVEGKITPSPLASLELGQFELFALFAMTSLLTVAAAVAVSRIEMPPSATIFCFVPAVFLPYLVGSSLRDFKAATQVLAFVYLIVGSFLTGLGVVFFLSARPPLAAYSQLPLLCSVSLQLGLAILITVSMTLLDSANETK